MPSMQQLRGAALECSKALMHVRCMCRFINQTLPWRLPLHRDTKHSYLLMFAAQRRLLDFGQPTPLLAIFFLGPCRQALRG